MLRAPVAAIAAAALTGLGCAGLAASRAATPSGFHGNLLANPGFEQDLFVGYVDATR